MVITGCSDETLLFTYAYFKLQIQGEEVLTGIVVGSLHHVFDLGIFHYFEAALISDMFHDDEGESGRYRTYLPSTRPSRTMHHMLDPSVRSWRKISQ